MARISRRHLLLGGLGLAGVAALGATFRPTSPTKIPGRILGADAGLGHRLRGGDFPPVTATETHDTLIVGGGIAGLSAAWTLDRAGQSDYLLLEMAEALGGNSRSGHNEVSSFPWGAHYVPLLTPEARAAQALFGELGIITGWRNGQPIYNDYFLSADPHERLLIAGHWQDGLVPQLGVTPPDQEQFDAFFSRIQTLKTQRGTDGKPAFAIPLAYSSRDTDLLALDSISMADWLAKQKWDAKPLRWYVDYCCRDDYGAPASDVSAWAGLHYFAARHGHGGKHVTDSVLTWPEGNGWIVNRMQERLRGATRTGLLAYSLNVEPDGATLLVLDTARNTSLALKANAVILAVPHFIASRLLNAPLPAPHQYSPWLVANVTLNRLPQGKGSRLAWDNVVYDSKLLGYVVATHQNLNRVQNETVITYYWPLDHLPPALARKEALTRSYQEWQDIILAELRRIHPELNGAVRNLDVWLWGHGMIRPSLGYIWNPNRMPQVAPPLFLAHADQSGISIFEEANYQGVRAAEALLRQRQLSFESLL